MAKAAAAHVLIMLIVSFVIPAAAGQEISERALLTEPLQHKITRGRTTEFGGGSFIRIDFGERATLVFIWGTREDRGPITVISRGADILGHRYTENGTKVPVLSDSVTVYRLEGLVEFEDENRNGIYDPSPTTSTVDAASSDRIIKASTFDLAWTFQQRAPVVTRDGIEWSFSLEARNVSYSRIVSDTTALTAAAVRPATFVESIKFVFHLKASVSSEKRTLIDLRSDTVSTSLSAETGSKDHETERLNLTTKMDHVINGWDFAGDNQRPALMLRFGLHMGRTYDLPTAREVFSLIRDHFYGDSSVMVDQTEDGSSTIWDEARNRVIVKKLDTIGSGGISLIRKGSELSGIFWDDRLLEFNDEGGRTLKARVQVTNVSLIGPEGSVWKSSFLKTRSGIGITVKGVFTYPRSVNIHHDPGIQTFAWSLKKEPRRDDGHWYDHWWEDAGDLIKGRQVSVSLVLVIVCLLVAVAIVSSLSRRRMDRGDEELRREEEEIFVVRTRKRDWDKLRPK
ncbi:MAG: hypothetical protein ACMUHY_07200 [Thermoplasmatota archaeon]